MSESNRPKDVYHFSFFCQWCAGGEEGGTDYTHVSIGATSLKEVLKVFYNHLAQRRENRFQHIRVRVPDGRVLQLEQSYRGEIFTSAGVETYHLIVDESNWVEVRWQ